MSASENCSLPNRHNLIQPIHLQLFQKLKLFVVLLAFTKFRLNFGHFPKRDDLHSLFISEATACQKRC